MEREGNLMIWYQYLIVALLQVASHTNNTSINKTKSFFKQLDGHKSKCEN
jgi:hypothetical protein